MMARRWHVQDAQMADVPSIMHIMDAAFIPEFGERWTLGQTESTLAMPHSAALIALCAESSDISAAVGFLIYRIVLGESEMLMLGVDPAHRGQGVARALMKAWQAQCDAAHVSFQFLEVRSNNPALQLYEYLGFSAISERPNYYRGANGQSYNAITMRKS